MKRLTSAQCFQEYVDLLLADPAKSLLPEQKMGEKQVQNLDRYVLESTFLVAPKVGVHV